MFQALSVIFGLILGSFLTVCIYRIPYGREKGFNELDEDQRTSERDFINILYPPRSFCPECRAQLLWWHNIPVVGWLILRGRCAFCSARIPIRYPLVELFTAFTTALSFYMFDFPTACAVLTFCCALIVLSVIDSEYYIIPNVITYPGMLIGIVLGVINQFGSIFTLPVAPDLASSLWGLLLGGGFLLLVSEVYFRLRKKVGLGFGDVKLLAMTGLWFGPECALYTIFAGSLIGSVTGIIMLLALGQKLSKPLPFGPYLAAATYLYIFTNPDLGFLLV